SGSSWGVTLKKSVHKSSVARFSYWVVMPTWYEDASPPGACQVLPAVKIKKTAGNPGEKCTFNAEQPVLLESVSSYKKAPLACGSMGLWTACSSGSAGTPALSKLWKALLTLPCGCKETVGLMSMGPQTHVLRACFATGAKAGGVI